MGHAGTSRKSLNGAPWEALSLRLSRPVSAPLLTPVRAPAGYLYHSWQLLGRGDRKRNHNNEKQNPIIDSRKLKGCAMRLSFLSTDMHRTAFSSTGFPHIGSPCSANSASLHHRSLAKFFAEVFPMPSSPRTDTKLCWLAPPPHRVVLYPLTKSVTRGKARWCQ